MQTVRARVVEMMTQMEHTVGKGDLITQNVRVHQYNANSKLQRTSKYFKKSFQNETKGVGNVIAQTIKEMSKQTIMHGQLLSNLKRTLLEKER